MQYHAGYSIIRATLLLLFALIVLGPTSADGAVSSKTARAVTSSKSSVSKSTSRKSSRKRHARRSRRHRRACNTAAGVKQAIELVRTQSSDLCKMTGLEYVTSGTLADSVRASMSKDEGEYDDPEQTTETETETTVASKAQDVESNGNEVTTVGMSPEDEADHAQELLEQEAEDDLIIDQETFKSLWLSYVDGSASELTDAGIEKQKLMDMIMQWLGTRYHFGGTTSSGIDCSAFVREMYHSTAGIELPRTASDQISVGVSINKRENLKFGDLVFFNTRRRVRVGHVGIYLGDHLFAHASSRFGVTISSLQSTYYNKRYIGARRLDERSVAAMAPLPGS